MPPAPGSSREASNFWERSLRRVTTTLCGKSPARATVISSSEDRWHYSLSATREQEGTARATRQEVLEVAAKLRDQEREEVREVLDRAALAREEQREKARAELDFKFDLAAQARELQRARARAEFDRAAHAREEEREVARARLDRAAKSREEQREQARAELERAAQAREEQREKERAELERAAQARERNAAAQRAIIEASRAQASERRAAQSMQQYDGGSSGPDQSDNDCCICLEPIDLPVSRPCGIHPLHVHCEMQWRRRCLLEANLARRQNWHATCPVCRVDI